MPTRHRITCINKADRYDPWERITHVGGIDGGRRWKLSPQQAVEGIEAGKWVFFVRHGGREVPVVVAVSRYGNKYLKTANDGEQPNNLLSLPECP